MSAAYSTAGNDDSGISYILVNGNITISNVIQVSVGSQVRFWNCINPTFYNKHLVEVDWSVSGGQLISGDTTKTNYSLDSGKYEFVPANWADTAIISPGPTEADYEAWFGAPSGLSTWSNYDVEKIAFYVDNTVGSQVWTLLMKFSDGTSTSISWYLTVTAPTLSSPTFTSPTGGNVFQFGPFLKSLSGTEVDTPVSWSNSSYLSPPPGSSYYFGCISGTANAWTSQWSLTNSTPSTGYSYCVQLVRILAPPEVTYAKTGYNAHIHIPVLGPAGADQYQTELPRPKDGSGIVLWGLDGAEISITDFPWAYNTDAFTQFPANSGELAVPPATSIKDVNGTAQSFYADNPNRKVDVTLQPVDPLIEMNTNWQFVTNFAWHPDGGIPISLAQYRWSLDCNEYNATADLTPTVANSFRTSGNWDLTKTFQTLGSNSFVPTYLQWNYNQDNYKGNVSPAIIIYRPKKASGGGPNLAPMGSGSMNGPVTVPNFGNQALLPRGGAANFVGMNGM